MAMQVPSYQQSVEMEGLPGVRQHLDIPQNPIPGLLQQTLQTDLLGNIAEIQAKQENMDDLDAMSEIDLKTSKAYIQTKQWMELNPQSYEEYGSRFKTVNENLQEELKPWIEKLSPRARQHVNISLKKQSSVMELDVGFLSQKADRTVKRNNFISRIEQYALSGDIPNAQVQLEAAKRTGTVREDESELFQYQITRRAEFGEASRMIEANPGGGAESLKERNENGYAAFPNLSEPERRQLISYAEQQNSKKNMEADDRFYGSIQNGTYPSEAEVEEHFKWGEINQKQRNLYIDMVRKADAQRAASNQKISQAEAKARDKQLSYNCDNLEFQIMETPWPQDAGERSIKADEFNKRIYSEFAAENPTYAKRLKSQLKSSLEAFEKPDSTYKHTPHYVYAMSRLDTLEKDLYIDPDGLWNKDDTKETKLENKNLFKLKIDEYIRQHPEATQKDIDTFMDDTKKQINATEVTKRLDTWAAPSKPALTPNMQTIISQRISTNLNPGEIRQQTPDGRIIVYDAQTRKPIREEKR